jgi:NAD(P)-dependent dehydrogenase (short-subunit alcohol dehydrogenase family)
VKEFSGKVAVVTGAASGIGRGLAERFAAEGLKVVLADIEAEALAMTEAEFRKRGAEVLAVLTDVSNLADVEALAKRALDRFGAIHIVCNNAGVAGGGVPIWETTLADWQWVMGVNLWSVVHGVRTFVPIMLEQGEEGHIVNTASVAGLVRGGGIYGVTKHAVVALSESLYVDLANAGAKVKVSVLCPGYVNTNIGQSERNRPAELQNRTGEMKVRPEQEQRRAALAQALATGMPPGEVANVVLDAIKEERFYVLPHPQFKTMVRDRLERILDERNPDVGAPAALARPGQQATRP